VNKQGLNVQIIEVLPHLPENPIFTPFEMVISSNRFLDDNSAGVVIFTSGTTGRPKGAVMRRAYTHETALAIGEGYDIDHNDVILHVLPVHHTTGLGTSFFAFLVRGAYIEFNSVSFDPAWIWERWRQGGITVFSAVPTMYMRLKWFYEQNLAKLPEIERLRYTNAVAQLRAMLCGSSALQQHIQDFWTGIRNGKPILTRYGASEFPACLRVPAGVNLKALPRGCVGTTVPGVDLKLTEGEHGELLVKSPYMFSKYA
jgi:malonyl-CoA/methylmalonyl-CoA synthetase